MPSEIGPEFRGNWQAVVGSSEFVTAAELEGATPTLTIRDVRRARLESLDADGAVREGLVVYFGEARKGWVINRTNATCLAALWGDNVAGWIGKRVTLCAEMVRLGSKEVLGIRVVGSPDLNGPVNAEIKLPRRKPIRRTLRPT